MLRADYHPGGCVDRKECDRCGVVVTMGGKPGTRNGNVVYVYGPCLCGLHRCPACGDQPEWLGRLGTAEVDTPFVVQS